MNLQMGNQHIIASEPQRIMARLKFIVAADKITFILSPMMPFRYLRLAGSLVLNDQSLVLLRLFY